MVLGMGALTLSGCSIPQMTIPPDVADIEVSRRQDLLVVTNRHVSQTQGIEFDSQRSDTTFYCDYGISVPPDRNPGQFSFPKAKLDPKTQFFVDETTHFTDQRGFLDRLNQRVLEQPVGERNIVLFVHGYNVSYPGAVFRAAQIATDFAITQPMVLFSWPSAGRLSRYAYDRDSVLYARMALAQTLQLLSKSRAENIMVMGHSMGGLLVMEAIKRLALEDDRKTLDRLVGVALVQPDIDVDLFRRQVEDIRPYNVDLAVFASRRDRALKLSAVLTGGHPRVGEAENIEELRNLGVVVIDTSGAPKGDPLGHASLMHSPALLSMISSGELVNQIVAGSPGQDILISGLSMTGNAALAIAYLPYTIAGN